MEKVFKKIENELARRIQQLESLREQLRLADSNNVFVQSQIHIEIAILSRELEAIERLYQKLRE